MENIFAQALMKVRDIQKIIKRTHPAGMLPYQLDPIRKAILELHYADDFNFHGIANEGHILDGSYIRYEQRKSTYDTDPDVIIDIKYNMEANPCWERFVVCKEMCHSTFPGNTQRVKSEEELLELVEAIRLPTGRFFSSLAHASEDVAMMMASEILCPIDDRVQIMEDPEGAQMSHMALATKFKIPEKLIPSLFDPSWMEYVIIAFDQIESENVDQD